MISFSKWSTSFHRWGVSLWFSSIFKWIIPLITKSESLKGPSVQGDSKCLSYLSVYSLNFLQGSYDNIIIGLLLLLVGVVSEEIFFFFWHTGIRKNISTLMGAPLRYNFKQFPRVHHPCQHILGISRMWLKMLVFLYQNYYPCQHTSRIFPLVLW